MSDERLAFHPKERNVDDISMMSLLFAHHSVVLDTCFNISEPQLDHLSKTRFLQNKLPADLRDSKIVCLQDDWILFLVPYVTLSIAENYL